MKITSSRGGKISINNEKKSKSKYWNIPTTIQE
jgi:hypothetical protein